MIEELVARVFHARDVSHLAHWATSSYSQHMALGDFYDDVIDALDAIVEAHQADQMLGDVKRIAAAPPKNMVNYLDTEVEWIKEHRDEIADGCSAIANLIDALTEVYLKTIYKLDRLK